MKAILIALLLSANCGKAQELRSFERFDSRISMIEVFVRSDNNSQYNTLVFRDSAGMVQFKDSAGTYILISKVDSATAIRYLLNGILSIIKWESISNARREHETAVAYRTAGKWATLAKWLCQDFGINFGETIELMRRHSYKAVNLNNRGKSKKKI